MSSAALRSPLRPDRLILSERIIGCVEHTGPGGRHQRHGRTLPQGSDISTETQADTGRLLQVAPHEPHSRS